VRRAGPLQALGLSACAALALAACGAGASNAGWPKSAGTVPSEDWTEDGGESIAPRSHTPAAAVERTESAAEPQAAVVAGDVEVPPAVSADPTAPGDPAPTGEEIQLEEEIIIEISD
jgi:hypothetical protein